MQVMRAFLITAAILGASWVFLAWPTSEGSHVKDYDPSSKREVALRLVVWVGVISFCLMFWVGVVACIASVV